MDSKAVQPSRRKQRKLTRIEKYNLSELCWKMYVNMSGEADDLVHVLNHHLDLKLKVLIRENKVDPSFVFPKITRIDVRCFLEQQQEKISRYLGVQRRRMLEESFDVIKKIQDLTLSTEETMLMWQAKMEDALNKNNDRELMRASGMVQKERAQLQQLIKDLAQLLGKVKTYITVDALQQQVMSIADIIESAQGIEVSTKLNLLEQITQTLEITVSTRAS
jgi:hypothetical protein